MKLTKLFLLLLIMGSVAGCTTVQGWVCPDAPKEIVYVDRPVTVKVPVAAKCAVPQPLQQLNLTINNIDESYKDKPDKVGAAYIKTIRELKDRVAVQEKLLDVYRNQDGEDQAR